ncbi:autotransporter outer membrane beta-barrel domain-containing protein [Azospirillum thermophilum]|uniref:Autotransporter domain-containing protein n=1 Tax=Azospirillum thermophilum TaxID=2202148 RepID=A0A2S2D073_9PROT|nr:autotransporter domain-containing protein [Azospirillum thermophilum]AWK90098.1 hypothetical protein DEW08_29380 [Azospirillum thermophilum]
MPHRHGLLATTALHGCAGLALLLSGPAMAQFMVTSGSTVTTAQTLSGNQTGTVQAGGTLSTSGVAVTLNNVTSGTGVRIDNGGSILSTGTSTRAIDSSGTAAGTRIYVIDNGATGIIRSANDAIRINTNYVSGSLTINNSGLIETTGTGGNSGQAIDLNAMTQAAVAKTIDNAATGIIRTAFDDAIRPGVNTVINNAGLITNLDGAPNTSGGDNGTADGIDIRQPGVVVNNLAGGVISGARHGVTIDQYVPGTGNTQLLSATVTNAAGGVIRGRNGSGVGSDGNGTVINYGLISGDYAGAGNIRNSSGVASLNGDGDGVDIDVIGTVVNYGTIQGTGAGGVDSGGQPNGADGIAMGGGSVTNHAGGLISGVSRGIMVDNGSGGAGYGATTIVNAGRIEGLAGPAITLVGPYDDTVTNSGTIAGGGANPVAIDFGDGNDTLIIQGGSITGRVLGGGGTNSLVFQLGAGNGYTLGGGSVFSDFTTATVSSGTLTVNGPLALSGGLAVAAGAGLAGSGSIATPSATVSGTVSPGSGAAGTLSLGGAVTFAAGSRLQVAIDPAGNAGKLAVGGTATISSGAALQVAPLDGLYLVPRSYEVLTAAGGVTGQFGAVERLNPERLGASTLSLGQTGTSVVLTLNPGNPFNGQRNSVNIANTDIGYDLTGAGSGDSLTMEGRSTVRANMANLGLLQVGTSTGTATSLSLASGTQTVTSTVVKPNASLSVDGRLASSTVTVESGGRLGGGGTIAGTLINQGTLDPGNSPGILTVAGAVTNGSASSVRIEIDGATAGTGAGFHDRIDVTGTPGTFTAGGTLVPVTRGISGSATNGYSPVPGQGFTVVTASGGLLGSFAGITQPASGLPAGTRFDAVYGGNALTLHVTPASYARLAAAGVAATANRTAVGTALETLRPAAGVRPSDAVKPLFDALYPLGAAAIPAALDRLGGVVHAEALTAARDSGRLFGDVVFGRTATLRAAGQQASADAVTFWARAVGRIASSDGDGNTAGFRTRSGGLALGADRRLSDTVTAGAALGYQRTAVEARGDAGKTDLDSYSVALYGGYSLDGWFADGQAGYAYGHYDSRRPIRFGSVNPLDRTATATSGGHSLNAALVAGRSLTLGGTRIEPAAGLRIDRVTRSGFTEGGAGILGLAVEDETLTTLRGSLGVKAAWTLKAGDATVEPELRARWDHDFLDVAAGSRASLAGTSFRVSGTRPGRDAAVLGAGLTAELDGRLQAFGSYDADLRRDAVGHTLSAGLRYRW